MHVLIKRRTLIATAIGTPWLSAANAETPSLKSQIAALEKTSGGRLGVAVLDTATQKSFAWRGDERFAFCSAFKLLLTAAILQRIDRLQEQLSRRVTITAADMLPSSPVSERYVGQNTATVAILLQGLIEYSDNAAANLMLASIGGPPGLTNILRGWGDTVTRLDRTELALNAATPGDPRDTTSPTAMVEDLRRLMLGNLLSPNSRGLLIGWMKNCQTGKARLRAGMPPNWSVGDKTGTNGLGTANDIAIAWPPGRPPLLITCFLTGATVPSDQQNATHAGVARAIVTSLAR